MRCALALVVQLTIVLASSSSFARQTGQDDDYAKLQGTWALVSMEVEGKELPMEELRDSRLVIKGKKYTFRFRKREREFHFTLDQTSKAKGIDLQVAEGSESSPVYYGIYALEKGKLKVCRSIKAGHPRPKAFTTKADSGSVAAAWRREDQ
jgi:uncharacterized protein (TIGR03067 family)